MDNNLIKDVFQFNHDALGIKPRVALGLTTNDVKFLGKALLEEVDEFSTASIGFEPRTGQRVDDHWKLVHQVDALIDAAYFAVGGLARAGLTKEQAMACFDAIHEANMRKKLGVNANRGDLGTADAVKPADWVPPERTIYKILFGEEPTP